MADDGFDLEWREVLAAGPIAQVLKGVPQFGALVYPSFQMIHGCAWVAVGEVEQGELLLGVGAYGEFFSSSSFFFYFYFFHDFFVYFLCV